MPSFLYPQRGGTRPAGAGKAAPQALHECDPHFLSVERKRASPVQKKGVCIGSLNLEELHALRSVDAVYMASP